MAASQPTRQTHGLRKKIQGLENKSTARLLSRAVPRPSRPFQPGSTPCCACGCDLVPPAWKLNTFHVLLRN